MISYPSLTQYHNRRKSALCWSVLMKEDGFGWGYVAQRSSANFEAMREGWVLVSSDLTLSEACQLRDDLRSGEMVIEDVVV